MVPPQTSRNHASAQDFLSREWEDVTDMFAQARTQMAVGEMIHTERFNLYAAMSAIQLMDPKMDVGCGTVRNLDDIQLPLSLSDIQVINIMDHLLACEMSWMEAHTLSQTVFSCVYSQRLTEIPNAELFSYMRILLATMDSCINVIIDEKVADEEDFVFWTSGFRFPTLHYRNSAEADRVLQQIVSDSETRDVPDTDEAKALARAITLRLKFRIAFFNIMRHLTSFFSESPLDQVSELLRDAEEMVNQWASCPFRHEIDRQLIKHLFDPSINRHMMTSTPPRTAALMNIDTALAYASRIVKELRATLELKKVALPPDVLRLGSSDATQRYSLHVALHAVENFFAFYNPTTLTRSILSRLVVPERSNSLFGQEAAHIIRMIGTDMGIEYRNWDAEPLRNSDTLQDGVVSLFECLFRNRSRKRRQLLTVLRWWDHYAFMTSSSPAKVTELNNTADETDQRKTVEEVKTMDTTIEAESEPSQSGDADDKRSGPLNLFPGRSTLQIVAYEVSCRLMVQHWLLGFECDLYQEYEYAAVYFYVGYVLTSLCSASMEIADSLGPEESLHPVRIALHQLDDGRRWLCRALFSLLQALSDLPQFNYSCHRGDGGPSTGPKMFGSEDLWYEQRFGVMRGLMNGPGYADHALYESYTRMQEESLLKDSPTNDVVFLKLKEASSAFQKGRQMLGRAKKTAELYSAVSISEEAWQLARVAVQNSLVVSKAISAYQSGQALQMVSFKFTKHRNFPMVDIKDGT